MTIKVLAHDDHKDSHFESYEFEMPEFEFTLETNGKGLWTVEAKKVRTTKLELTVNSEKNADHRWGELRVYFDTNTWNTTNDGLIYTDPEFMDGLEGCLDVVGLNDNDVDYSEQGMQGKDYVSCDVGDNFIASWELKMWEESELAGA
jgi:hypothetical protein